MKRLASAIICLVCLSANASYAASKYEPASDKTSNVDVSLTYGGEPLFSGMGVTMGGGLGYTYMSTATIGVRADINTLNWSKNSNGTTSYYNRLPLFLGFRFYQSGILPYYFEAGVEASSDYVSGGTGTTTRFGVSPGVGMEAPVGEKYYIGGDLRYHILTDPYYSVTISFGKKF
ncbi:MAG: outer membrane beta-barrel protein [Nitrospinae bacterium]|nr:outer membrane beta-barrel protein [Nitrospinota bacterium]